MAACSGHLCRNLSCMSAEKFTVYQVDANCLMLTALQWWAGHKDLEFLNEVERGVVLPEPSQSF